MTKPLITPLLFVILAMCSCANLYKYQIGDIAPAAKTQTPFEIRLSATGFNVKEAGGIAEAVGRGSGNARAGRNAGTVGDILSLFQVGPRTGEPTFSDDYADVLFRSISNQCPNGIITGLVVIRERRKYPVVSGEIVKVTGFCQTEKAPENREKKK